MAEIFLFSTDRSLAEEIGDAIGRRFPVQLVQSADALSSGGTGLIVVDQRTAPFEQSFGDALGTLSAAARGMPVIAAMESPEAQTVLRAIRSGATDVLDRDAGRAEIVEVLTRHLTRSFVESGRKGRVILVLGPDAEAVATLSVDLAIGTSADLLVDCTLPTSAAEDYLDMKVDYGVAAAIADLTRMDAGLLSSSLARHEPSGMMVLTLDGGSGGEPPNVSPADFTALIRLVRAFCDEIVISAGNLRHAGLLRDLVALADQVLLVCAQSIRQVEQSRLIIEKGGPDVARGTRLLVWDHQPKVLLDSRRVAETLGIERFHEVPVDPVQLRNALNAGRPLALGKEARPYLKAVCQALESGEEAQPSANGGLLRWVKGRRR